MGLTLSRKQGEEIMVDGARITIRVDDIRSHEVRITVDAPDDTSIYRKEVLEDIREEAAEAGMGLLEYIDEIRN